MHILVTGGAGFIGSHLVDSLIQNQWDGCGWTKNYNITVIDDFSTGKRANVRKHRKNQEIIEKDLLSFKTTRKYDIIYHLASDANARSQELSVYEKNVALTKKAISLLRKGGKFVYASSCSIYGNNPFPKEEDSFAPLGFYAMSKVIGEAIVKETVKNYNIFRFGNVFGERQAAANNSFIVAIIKEALSKNKKIKLFNSGKTKRDYIYVKDLVRYMLEIQETGTFNLGTGSMIKTNDLVKASKVLYEDGGFVPEPREVCLNIQKLKEHVTIWNTKDIYDFLRGN